jgi:predicted dehydrogenase
MSTPVRVAVLGLGQRGLQHVNQLWKLEQEGLAQIVALCDAFESNLDPAKITNYVPGLPADQITRTTNVDAVIESGDVDALYIVIPPNVHRGEVVRAARAGIHLFVEKPVSLFLDEAIEMETAIREAGILSTVGFQQRFDAAHEVVHDFLQGKRAVMATYTRHAPIESHNVKHTPTEASKGPANRIWTANRAWSGTTMVEGGIHPLDLWRYWLGDVAWVQAVYTHRPDEEIFDGADNPYTYSATFGFKNGAVGTMILSRLRRAYFDETDHKVLWNEGVLEITRDGVEICQYEGEYPPAQMPRTDALRRSLALPHSVNSTYGISRAFVQAIAEKRPELIRSPFSEAMNSHTAVLAANISDELGGQRVDLDELLTAEKYARFRQKTS